MSKLEFEILIRDTETGAMTSRGTLVAKKSVGKYAVRLTAHGQWQWVLIDDGKFHCETGFCDRGTEARSYYNAITEREIDVQRKKTSTTSSSPRRST